MLWRSVRLNLGLFPESTAEILRLDRTRQNGSEGLFYH